MAPGKKRLGGRVVAQAQSLSSETYLPKLLEGLQSLRSQNALCDVVLEAEGAPFPAHKAVLAVASSYCKVRFAGEAASQVTQLKLAPPVTARGLQGVLSFVYSNRLELTLQTVEEVFRAAEALLVREVMGLSFQFLEGALDRDTCLAVLRITQGLGPEELKQKARRCVSKHCCEILKDPAQLKELDKTTLCELLDRGDTSGLSELELFQAAVGWLDHDSARWKDAADVLRPIRFPFIPLPDLQTFVQEIPIMKTEPACRRYLQEALDYHIQPYTQPVLQSEHTQVRNRNDMLIVLGGRSADNAICGDVWAADPHCHLWKTIGKLSRPVYNHCVAVLRDFVFVMGGQESFDPTGQHPSNKVFRFDPRHNTWLQLASLLVRRTRFFAGVLNERLVAVGGGALLGTLTNTTEEYLPAKNKWWPLTPFPVPVADHAGTTHRGILYISGGFAEGQTLCTMYSYLSRLRCWIRNRPMAFARCDHGMATVGDRIFCLGGRALTNAQEWVPVSEAEYYCPATDRWARLHLSAIDLCHFSLTTTQLQLYVTGGGTLRRRSKEDGVWVCHPSRRTWEKVGCLPRALADHACCFVHVPRWIASPREPQREGPSDDPLSVLEENSDPRVFSG
ncbi:kelch-like protein 9 [Python bivittatus]|uniref:Kelch-like protein 9 n=1 Tax=Python bivittatus TaxID=176946 RepID=A0A9F5IQE2_PYTBI|nr:kelch-like protein 9 [Python bivittatus]